MCGLERVPVKIRRLMRVAIERSVAALRWSIGGDAIPSTVPATGNMSLLLRMRHAVPLPGRRDERDRWHEIKRL